MSYSFFVPGQPFKNMFKCSVCTVVDSVQEILPSLRVHIRLILIDADDLGDLETLDELAFDDGNRVLHLALHHECRILTWVS
jgi:hypothetical protein